jgi:hypothetical protein
MNHKPSEKGLYIERRSVELKSAKATGIQAGKVFKKARAALG